MELTRTENRQYEEYEELLLERDRLRKEAGQIWTVYMKTFGQLITEVFEEKVACIRQKKLIGYYQKAANRGQNIDVEALEKLMDSEMAEYQKQLQQLLSDEKRCRESGVSTLYEAERSKVLYRRLVKLLHPDIHPETDREEKLRELWTRIVEAYGKNDVKALSELEVLARAALKELHLDGAISVEIPDLEDRIRDLHKEMERIRTTEPYLYKALVEDPAAVEEKKQELQKELETYRDYHRQLDEAAETILREGGIELLWQMN